MPRPFRLTLPMALALLFGAALTLSLPCAAQSGPDMQAPLPPPRPKALDVVSGPPGAVVPELPKPLPPERPPELGGVPAGSNAVASPAPLPPPRPNELGQAIETAPPPASPPPPPPPRPAELATVPAPAPGAKLQEPPLPPGRPDDLQAHPGEGESPSEAAPLPPERPAELSGPALEQAILAVPEDQACLRSLDELGAKYEKHPAIVRGQCSIAHPVSLATLDDGAGHVIAVSTGQMVVCDVALALARWARDAQAVAEAELGERIKALAIGGYNCRGQNNVGEGKLSEHSFGNAVDVMSFSFGKRTPIAVGSPPEESPEAKFLDRVRAKACPHFRTVLGPGSNEAHADHLHFDQRQRNGNNRLCELRPPPSVPQSAKVAP